MRPRFVTILVSLVFCATAFAKGPATSCIACHGSDAFDQKARAKVHGFNKDVHSQVGISCHGCHGGNPDPALADDVVGAMDPDFKANPYRGIPASKQQVPAFCGTCHSSAEYMKKFNPSARVDEVNEYWTSNHGRKLKAGDNNVAGCIDCHSVHDIRRKSDTDSTVYPTHVADTCARCHSDAVLMKPYGLAVDQHTRWKASVHANAMLEKGDLVAPTCNDCHGNHGATPPGVTSIAFVCGQCHARESELFRDSLKSAGWARHNELLDAGGTCADCHDDARAKMHEKQLSGCTTCHDNHAILRPTVAMLGNLPDSPCAFCHEGTGPLANMVPEPKPKALRYKEVRAELLDNAVTKGLSGDARFDWLVDQALMLPTHNVSPDGKSRHLRPEFERLFDKFRIGKTRNLYRDSATGREVVIAVKQCTNCHQGEVLGAQTARLFLNDTRSVTSMIARSQRIVLAARRGGVEVRRAGEEIDAAVDSQIELEALVHTFNPGGEFAATRNTGLNHAKVALTEGKKALEELSYRRRGLLIALAVIMAALVALALKIRTMG